MLVTLLVVVLLAGGSSRADVAGQAVVRAASWVLAIIFIVAAPLPRWQRPLAPVIALMLAVIALPALQLIPLPPSIWLSLPGHELFGQAALVSGQDQPWRPVSISPAATWNALSSLIVPGLGLLLLAGLRREERWRLVPIMLGMVALCSFIALMQFSGARIDHPLINDIGSVSGFFANRNHFALFAAIGCLLTLAWAFHNEQGRRWKAIMSIILLTLFALIILATGSRAGMVVGTIAIASGSVLVRRSIKHELGKLPRKWAWVVIAAMSVVLITAIWLSVAGGRAVSIERALAMDAGADLRRLALPTLVEMTGKYFPFGSGFGTFDPAYRIEERAELLGPAYFNQAHNDWLQIVLDGGLAGLCVLMVAVAWWGWRSWQVWFGATKTSPILPRLGSLILLLVMLASIIDYPARTPLIMVVVVIAAVWLADGEWKRPGRAVTGGAEGSQDRA